MRWGDHLDKAAGGLMAAAFVTALGYGISYGVSSNTGPGPAVWPFVLCGVVFVVGALLYGGVHGMLPWQRYHALKRRAETAESALENTRADLEIVRRERDEARRELEDAQRAEITAPASTTSVPRALQPIYLQREPYRQPNRNSFAVEHRVGIRNPPANPQAASVRLEWTDMAPRPATEGGFPPILPPQPVPRLNGGDPRIGVTLPPGREDRWVIATAATATDGTILVGAFSQDSMGGQFRGLLWRFEPGKLWRFTYRIVADNQSPVEFSVTMTAVDGQIRCDLEAPSEG